MIRPEARKAIYDLREVIIGGVLVIIGGNWVVNGHTLQPLIGGFLGALGLVFLFLGWRRVRFPMGAGGAGVVEVTERQITYLTGTGGGAIAIDALVRVEVQTGSGGTLWVFTADDGTVLMIPGDATGAETLFDALVSLPGINYDQATRAAKAPSSLGTHRDTFLIWQKDKRALH